jgi:hypothetical protein
VDQLSRCWKSTEKQAEERAVPAQAHGKWLMKKKAMGRARQGWEETLLFVALEE